MSVSFRKFLYYSVALIVGTYFLFKGIVAAMVFLGPFVTAVILALLLLSLSNKFESWGLGRAISSFLCTFVVFLVSLIFFALVAFQINTIVKDWDKIRETMLPKIEQLTQNVTQSTSISQEEINTLKNKSKLKTVVSQGGNKAMSFVQSFISFLGNYILVFIYLFFLLRYRRMFKVFILKLTSTEDHAQVRDILDKSSTVAQEYLMGRLILISLLAVLYSIGLGVSGVSNFIIVSLLAAFFTLIPYLGNVIGIVLAILFGYVTTGDMNVLIGVLITFTVVQFVESYVLTPFIIGDRVDVHPLFIIIIVIIGNLTAGILGMVLAIPVLGIINVICSHVPLLQPVGYLLSQNEDDS